MCVVSMVVGGWTNPYDKNYVPWTPQYPDPALARQMLEVLKRLEAIDKKLGLVDCEVEELKKRKFKRKLTTRAESGKRT